MGDDYLNVPAGEPIPLSVLALDLDGGAPVGGWTVWLAERGIAVAFDDIGRPAISVPTPRNFSMLSVRTKSANRIWRRGSRQRRLRRIGRGVLRSPVARRGMTFRLVYILRPRCCSGLRMRSRGARQVRLSGCSAKLTRWFTTNCPLRMMRRDCLGCHCPGAKSGGGYRGREHQRSGTCSGGASFRYFLKL
jgi:hypothetical protein